jgi:hypothetical protein
MAKSNTRTGGQPNPFAQGNEGAGYRTGNMPAFQPAEPGQQPGAMEWMNLIRNQRGQGMMNPGAASALGQFNQSLSPEQMGNMGQTGPLPAMQQMEQPNMGPFLAQLQARQNMPPPGIVEGESGGMPNPGGNPWQQMGQGMPPWAQMGAGLGNAMQGMFGGGPQRQGAQPMQQRQAPNIFERFRQMRQPQTGMQNPNVPIGNPMTPTQPPGGEGGGAQPIVRKTQMPRVRY